jgi:tRNA nucleotidyltransferase (CCA-adding enzyme)
VEVKRVINQLKHSINMAKDRLDSILDDVIRKVTPSQEESAKVRDMTEKVMSTTREVAATYPMKLTVVLAGSFVRDTWMPHKKEFDVFIQFPENTTRQDLEVYGLEIGKKVVKALRGKFIIAFAEHPYVRARVKDYAVDIVPSYRVSSAAKIKSAVDRTPFHNRWLEKHLPREKSAQVRLMKQFIKAQGLYGSDTRVQGFSGYLCELLIVKYRTFKALTRTASKWQPGKIFLDIHDHHKPSERSVIRFKGQPLLVIDPVDPERNVAAALSGDNFNRFVTACKMLVKKPTSSFFFKPEPKINISKLGTVIGRQKGSVYGILFPQPQIIQDVLWPQMRKAAYRLSEILKDNDFVVLQHGVWGDDEFTKGNSMLLIDVKDQKLPQIKKLRGPPIKELKHSENFLKKYKPLGRTYKEGRFWYAEFKREFKQADAKLKHTLSDPVKILREKGIPSHVAKAVAKDFKLLNEKQVISFARKNSGFAMMLKEWAKA